MGTRARHINQVTQPAIADTINTVIQDVLQSSTASQALKDAATNLQTFVTAYNTAFSNYNNEVPVSNNKADQLNADLTTLKVSLHDMKQLAKSLISTGMINAADYGALIALRV